MKQFLIHTYADNSKELQVLELLPDGGRRRSLHPSVSLAFTSPGELIRLST